MSGTIVSIHIAVTSGEEMQTLDQVNAIANQGLEGDRYYTKQGTFSKKDTEDRQLTLIEIEAIEALVRDYQTQIEPHKARRNLITRGIALNHLVGKEFQVGKVRLKGLRLCEPCRYLGNLVGEKVFQGLIHRGGLRAQILTDGVICADDSIIVE